MASSNLIWENRISCHPFEPKLRKEYNAGRQFDKWRQAYPQSLLFHENLTRPKAQGGLGSKQIPHSGKAKENTALFFDEFLVGVEYLKAGYEVLRQYMPWEIESAYGLVYCYKSI